MIEPRCFASLGCLSRDWLNTRLHFRHGDLGGVGHHPLGPLIVWNDDEIAPRSGFGLHPHRDVEIVTWVRSGAITHEDDAGNRARIVAGCTQTMSAGSGVHHAERNAESVPARLFQIWLRPRRPGGSARWATCWCSHERREGRFVTVASGDPADQRAGALPIDADARVRVATLREGALLRCVLAAPRIAYVVADQGGIELGPVRLGPRDGAVVTDEPEITLIAREDTDVVMVELLSPGEC
ncbi:pirin family protein [Burkholderia plantarii]|uniref:Pirin domain protein n=1 Tax=Burkholderia plantarii TaxID=41899 RepID=A0A0B6SBZ3_BURPL|nr:pirin family protein [Burkholderia plantarii]AJK50785.1 pirin domain protein [Burkholderia plantarii]